MTRNAKHVIIGTSGQLGQDLIRSSPPESEVVGLSHTDIEVCDLSPAAALIRDLNPTHLIDLSAFHSTDVCEIEQETSFRVNCFAKANLAKVCSDIGAVMIYTSTDYVFSGRELSPRIETDATDPINVYGISKRAGDHFQ